MTSQADLRRPEDCNVAVICALPSEFDAAILAFDNIGDVNGHTRGPPPGQNGHHIFCRVGSHDVVLVLLSGMGKVNAATETARLGAMYPGLELAVLTGICGGVPYSGTDEIVLGDVVISKSIVQYDLGRQYPGKFSRKDDVDHNLSRPNKDIRTLLATLETQHGLSGLQRRTAQVLAEAQQMAVRRRYRSRYNRPAPEEDILFEPAYPHRHQNQSDCGCSVTTACEGAISASCEELQCDLGHQVLRQRLESSRKRKLGTDMLTASIQESQIHIGRIGSGDTVMKSGEHRDRVAAEHGVIAFEMEGAGVWDEIPCIIVKGVCDYADSHKHKNWQDFAAAAAASTTKALLELYPRKERFRAHDTGFLALRNSNPEPAEPSEISSHLNHNEMQRETTITTTNHRTHCIIPLAKNRRFVERTEMSDLKRMLFDEPCQTAALVGLGGVGKTQMAVNIAYWTKENRPEYSIFWIPALSFASIEQAYTDIAQELGIRPESEGDDIKTCVRRYLCSKKAGNWLLVIDNADDMETLYGLSDGQSGLMNYLPQSENGITLFTTRLKELAMSVADDAFVELDAMNQDEAKSLLKKCVLRPQLLRDDDSVLELLGFLTYLPLAITQASAYLNRNPSMSIARYLQLLRGTEQTRTSTLSREFRDSTRYPNTPNAIATTWQVSFEQIRQTDSHATSILYFISRIEPKLIPFSILPRSGSEEETEYAIGTLTSYAFLIYRDETQTFDMHSLVHLATRIWAKKQSVEERVTKDAVEHLHKIFPSDNHENCATWRQFIPHALKVLQEEGVNVESEAILELHLRVGRCLLKDGRTKEAIDLLRHVVEVRESTLDEAHHSRLSSQHLLAGAYEADGQVNNAIKLLEHVVKVRESTLDEADPSRLASQHELARAYHSDRRIRDAIKLLRHVVKVQENTLDTSHPVRLASQHELARALEADGQVKEAIKLLEHVTQEEKTTLGEGHPSRLDSQHELARTLSADGRVKEAIKLLEYVMEMRKSTTPNEAHPSRLAAQHELARAYEADGRREEAMNLLEFIVEAKENTLEEGHPSLLDSQQGLACVYRSNGRIKEAISMLEYVMRIKKGLFKESHPSRLASQHELARTLLADGQEEEAIKLLKQIVEIPESTLEKSHPSRLASQHELARVFHLIGRIEEAIKLLEGVVEVESILDEGSLSRLDSQHELARAYKSGGRAKEAIALLEHVVGVKENMLSESDPSQLASQHVLAGAYKADGRVKDAIKLLEHVVEVKKRTLDESDPARLASEHLLAEVYAAGELTRETIRQQN
ncbi:phosphorylase superfamily protein [Colletotrichum truncatum]|uniref:Phosphorylase superfamily protein n=1 Tax=Colletotrichum truncatum TaxID=5467 RepID=A0ACC3YZ52_COLTU|nr:phosphorylase superfamily protein [Colletotrichum truncatum]KAF6786360.1 phosphorylase superfamily protein [Colletotrichum truncatum]